jgi:Spy/CpxP family protein refolding chaperone
MRDRILAALLTLAVFATGFLAGRWSEHHRPFPPPPGSFMGEFGARGPSQRTAPPVNRAQLADQIEKIRPQMDAFRDRVAGIYAEFDRNVESVLTPEQRDEYHRRFTAHRGYGPQPDLGPDTTPLSDEQIDQLMQRPFRTLAFFVVIPMTLERMTNELKLDDAQRAKVTDFLRARREKFIELVDSVPPPSLLLSRLAPMVQRLGSPQKPGDAPAH